MTDKITDKFGTTWYYKDGEIRNDKEGALFSAFRATSLEDGIKALKIFGYLEGDDDE